MSGAKAKVIPIEERPGWGASHDAALAKVRPIVAPEPKPVPNPRKHPRAGLPPPKWVLKQLDKLEAAEWAIKFCRSRGYPFRTVVGPSHYPDIVAVRHELWTCLRDTLGLSSKRVGEIFGVDHSTVLNAAERRHAAVIEMYGLEGVLP